MDWDENDYSEQYIEKKSTISVEKLKSTFLICAAMGLALAIFVSLNDVNQIVSMAISVGIMGLYWFVYFKGNSPYRLRDIFSDSVYYLGFLFTVMTLVVSMVSFDFSDSELSANAILGQFGMAMTTTLFGLFMRVYYKQFEISSHNAQVEVQKKLEDSVDAVIIKLDLITSSLSTFSDTLNEKVESMNSECQNVGILFSQTVDEITNKANKSLTTLSESISSSVKSSTNEINNHSVESLKEIVSTANELNAIHREFAKEEIIAIEGAIDNGFKVTAELLRESLVDLDANLTPLKTNINELNSKFKTLSHSITDGIASLQFYSEQTAPSMKSLSEESANIMNVYSKLSDNLNVIGLNVKKQIESIQLSETNASEVLKRTIEEYKELCQKLQKALEMKGVSRLVDEDEAWMSALKERREQLSSLTDEFESNNVQLKEASRLFSKNLVDLSKAIVKNLRD